jgi:hypothetical protein
MLGEKWLYRVALRPSVVHELPGRIRLHLPILKRVPEDMRGWLDTAAELIALRGGIETVEPCALTGSVLIHYDPTMIEGGEVVEYFNAFVGCAIDHLDQLRALAPEERGSWLRRLAETQPWFRAR